jgi:hypothetical protein
VSDQESEPGGEPVFDEYGDFCFLHRILSRTNISLDLDLASALASALGSALGSAKMENRLRAPAALAPDKKNTQDRRILKTGEHSRQENTPDRTTLQTEKPTPFEHHGLFDRAIEPGPGNRTPGASR